MEPQINYSGYQTSNSGTTGTKVYGRSGCANKGCFGIVGFAILAIVIILAGIFFAYPALTPNSIHGDFMDMTVVPQKDGSQKVWILTDGSFSFIQTTKSPGSYSTGRKCYFCKTWTYIYDPVSEKVLKKIKTPYEDIITSIQILYHNNQVWVLTSEYGQNEPRIEIFDSETGDIVTDTKAFIAKYPILSGGLAGLHYNEEEKYLNLKTKDGRQDVTYSFLTDKMYDTYSTLYEELDKATGEGSVLVLCSESSGAAPRKKAFLVTGPKGKLNSNKSSLESYANNAESLKFFVGGATSEPVSEKVYLEGLIYYQDNDCALIISLDQLGKKSNRILTCIDLKSKKEKWTVNQDQLFKKMKIDEEKDTFSSLFFTKDDIKVIRSANLVLVKLKGEGVMAFDYDSGKKLWTLNL